MTLDWNNIRYIIQIPLSWFRNADRKLNIFGDGKTVVVNRNHPDGTEISLGDGVLPSAATGTPVDGKDSPTVLDTNGASWTWQAGGDNGLELDCYCRIAPQQSGSAYSVFQRVRMTISKSGLVVGAQLLPDRIRIKASNS